MVESVLVLGLDPGFARMGYALVRLFPDPRPEELVAAGLIATYKTDKKRSVFAADDNFRRAKEISRELRKRLGEGPVKVICAEAMSAPPNASSAAKMSLAWGVIAALSEIHSIPVVMPSPQDIKFSLTGARSASKEVIRRMLRIRYEAHGFEVLTELERTVSKTDWEHPYDAIAAIVASLSGEVLRTTRILLQAGPG